MDILCTSMLLILGIAVLLIGISNLHNGEKIIFKSTFNLMMYFGGALWDIGYGCMLLQADSEVADIFRGISLVGMSIFLISVTGFFTKQIGEKVNLKLLVRISVYVGIICCLLVFGNNYKYVKTEIGYSYLYGGSVVGAIAFCLYVLFFAFHIALVFAWRKRCKTTKEKKLSKYAMVLSIIFVGAFFVDTGLNGIGIPMLPCSAILESVLLIISCIHAAKWSNLEITVKNFSEYIYSSVENPILIFGIDKKLKLANASATKFFQMSGDKLKNLTLNELFDLKQQKNRFQASTDSIEAIKMNTVDGVCLVNGASCSLGMNEIYDQFQDKIGEIVVVTDMSDKMKIIEELNESKWEAIHANQAKSAFLANMSHEIRTPMNSIIGMSEIILRKNIDEDLRLNIENILQAGQGLLSIINDVLDISKIESGKLELVKVPYKASQLIKEVANLIDVRLVGKPVKLILDINPTIPNGLIGDEVRMKQILINILGNAVKFTEEGHIKFTMDWAQEDVGIKLLMKVEDTGIGIKEEDLEKIFGEFNQVDTRKNRKITGSGLGLSICRSLAQLMEGNVTVESEYGKGTTFFIEVIQQIDSIKPIAQITNHENECVLVYDEDTDLLESYWHTLSLLGIHNKICSNAEEAKTWLLKESFTYVFAKSKWLLEMEDFITKHQEHTRLVALVDYEDQLKENTSLEKIFPYLFTVELNRIFEQEEEVITEETNEPMVVVPMPYAKILIVDDNRVNLQIAQGLMEPYEMTIHLANGGKESIEMVKKEKYDLIFMDHMMPDLDGMDATSCIRKMEGCSEEELPIVALTANVFGDTREMFLENGFNAFLEKPIVIEKLHKILEDYVGGKYKEQYEKDKERICNQMSQEEEKTTEHSKLGATEFSYINPQKGIQMIGGKEEDYRHVLHTYYEEVLENIERLKTLSMEDISLITTIVHGIKSSSKSIGADEISEKAKQLEMAGKSKDTAYVKRQLPVFLDEMKGLLQEIEVLLKELKEEEKQVEDQGQEVVAINKEMLLELQDAFLQYDIKKIEEILGEIKNQHYDEETTQMVNSIQENYDNFEYEEPVQIISNYLKTLEFVQ